MTDYKTRPKIKELIDQLQSKYKCCGNTEFANWFTISWIGTDYVDIKNSDVSKKIVGGAYIDNYVPWSCCNVESLRPCVTDKVPESNSKVNYNFPSDATLYKTGMLFYLL